MYWSGNCGAPGWPPERTAKLLALSEAVGARASCDVNRSTRHGPSCTQETGRRICWWAKISCAD